MKRTRNLPRFPVQRSRLRLSLSCESAAGMQDAGVTATDTPDRIFAPGTALGALASVALSSAQAAVTVPRASPKNIRFDSGVFPTS
jgi:hypothetical protein